MQITLKDVRINRTRPVEEKTATSHTYKRVPDGYELGDVVITIDTDSAARYLAEQAMRNKTGKAKYGFATAKVIKRKRYPEPLTQEQKDTARAGHKTVKAALLKALNEGLKDL